MSKYLSVFEGRIKRQRQEIGKCQAEIMKGRALKANRELIAKAMDKIAANQKLIAVNSNN